MPAARAILGTLGAVTLALAGTACSVDEENIRHWKTTQHGPYKIRTALSDPDQPVALRAAAAVALAEIGLVEEMAGDLTGLSLDQARPVADGAAPRLERLLNGSGDGQRAVRAKDALFAIRGQLSPTVRKGADAALLRWLTGDLSGRSLLGAHGADRIVSTLGPTAGDALAELLEKPDADVAEVARLVALVDDAETRDHAAELLVNRAREKGPAKESVFLGLARLEGPRVATYLRDAAVSAPPDARLYALRALQVVPDPAAIPVVAQVAADSTLEAERAVLRDEAFGVLEELLRRGEEAARTSLLGFVEDSDDKVRWRAVGAIVESGDAQGLARLLDALPRACLKERKDLHDLLEAPLHRAGAEVLPTLRTALSSRSPAGRLVAARAVAAVGESEDVAQLEALGKDRARLSGWSGLRTVGAEARAAAARLRERLQ